MDLPIGLLIRKKHTVKNDPEWDEAMDMHNDTMQLINSSIYLTLKVKDRKGNWIPLSQNFSYLDDAEHINPAEPEI